MSEQEFELGELYELGDLYEIDALPENKITSNGKLEWLGEGFYAGWYDNAIVEFKFSHVKVVGLIDPETGEYIEQIKEEYE